MVAPLLFSLILLLLACKSAAKYLQWGFEEPPGEDPSASKFCIFLQKQKFRPILIKINAFPKHCRRFVLCVNFVL